MKLSTEINPLKQLLISDAIFSECRQYRYTLRRFWSEELPYAMFIGLNPSTADEINNDPTVTRCIKYAHRWGYGGLVMTNIFAYRATEPTDMKRMSDPIGPDNNVWLTRIADEAGIIVAAWGNHGQHMNRSAWVKAHIPSLHCLKQNASGEPAHPLYLRADLEPYPMVL